MGHWDKVWVGSNGPFLYKKGGILPGFGGGSSGGSSGSDGTAQGITLSDPEDHNIKSREAQYVNVAAASSPYSLGSEGLVFLDLSAGAATLTLPNVTSSFDSFEIRKIDYTENAVVLAAQAGELIEQRSTWPMAMPLGRMRVKSDGSVWRLMR